MAVEPASSAGGVIHDLGYRPYEGQRLGRAYSIRSLYWNSLRTAFGIGRGVKAMIIPFSALAIVCIPAVVTVGVLTFQDKLPLDWPIHYWWYPGSMSVVIIAFLATQGAELVCPDQRNQVLPLYFSRPIRRTDYAWAKLGAMATALAVLMAVPAIVQYLGTVFTTTGGIEAVGRETRALLHAFINVGVWSAVLAAFGLALASLSTRRVYAAGAVVAWNIITVILVGIISSEVIDSNGNGDGRRWGDLFNPVTLLNAFQHGVLRLPGTDRWDNSGLYLLATIAFFALCVGVLMTRYRRVSK